MPGIAKTIIAGAAVCLIAAALMATPSPARAGEGGVQWLGLEDALARQKQDPRPVLVFFHLSWCFRCKKMERTTYRDPEVIQTLNQRFWPALVDMSQEEAVGKAYGVDYIPTHLVLLPGGETAWRKEGVIPIDAYRRLLEKALNQAGPRQDR